MWHVMSSRNEYAYVKIAGILAKSFIGRSARRLFEAKSQAELYEMLFRESVPSIPEYALTTLIEEKAKSNFVCEYLKILSSYDKPPRLLLKFVEYFDVKNLESLLVGKLKKNKVQIIDTGCYSSLNYKKYEKLHSFASLTKHTAFEWVAPLVEKESESEMFFKMDAQQVSSFLKVICALPKNEENTTLKEFFLRYYSIKNMIWALRLKVSYFLNIEDIVPHLFRTGDKYDDALCQRAFDAVKREDDVYEKWKKWEFFDSLNPHVEGEVWKIDVAWVERKLKSRIMRETLKMYKEWWMSDFGVALFCMLKMYELMCIRAAAEGLRLNVDKEEAMSLAGYGGEV